MRRRTVGLARAEVRTARSDESAEPVGSAPPPRIDPYCDVSDAISGGTEPPLPVAWAMALLTPPLPRADDAIDWAREATPLPPMLPTTDVASPTRLERMPA